VEGALICVGEARLEQTAYGLTAVEEGWFVVNVAHIFVGAGEGPCVIFMAGGREHRGSAVYVRSELALRYGAGTESQATQSDRPYTPFPKWQPGPPASFDGLPFG
jgi:hypothetical protein